MMSQLNQIMTQKNQQKEEKIRKFEFKSEYSDSSPFSPKISFLGDDHNKDEFMLSPKYI